jgi:hypothetical protein
VTTNVAIDMASERRTKSLFHKGEPGVQTPCLSGRLHAPHAFISGCRNTMTTQADTNKRTRTMKPASRRRIVSSWLSILGLMSLCYLLGAAAMFFELPTSDFLSKAFIGARSWNEQRQIATPTPEQESHAVTTVTINQPAKTFAGFTLYACASADASNTQVFLMNMRGEVVHKWEIPFSMVWPDPRHLPGRVQDFLVCIFACHLYPNGDLLVVFHGLEHYVNGYGLAKLDKASKVIWKYPANVHHDVDVGEDGTIYAIQHQMVDDMPKGLEFIQTPTRLDYLVMLTSEGKPKKKPISILEAFRDSPYSALLASLDRRGVKDKKPTGLTGARFDAVVLTQDVLHANFVTVLRRDLASKFPAFKAGQVLISLRHLDSIAVMDVEKGSIVWAARGPWQGQHDPQFLDNGHLLLFDNRSLPRGSRVLEYDPQTLAIPWSYPGVDGTAFYSSERGMCQRLPNGNTLIVNSEGGELFEVTQAKAIVWSFSMKNRFINYARRYSPDQLHFLTDAQRARP